MTLIFHIDDIVLVWQGKQEVVGILETLAKTCFLEVDKPYKINPMKFQRPTILVKLFRGPMVRGITGCLLQSKRQIIASCIPYNEERNTAPGRTVWILEEVHSIEILLWLMY